MIGAYTIGKKAVTFGYRRYGVPGAIASGGAALAGYIVVRRALKSSTNDGTVDSAIDAGEIQSAVDEQGLQAVADTETLEQAIDTDELDTPVDIDDVQSSVDEETDTASDSDSSAGKS
ncbi:hypothetical protein [Natrinema sp. HArc-T2]|uniref:hypothetical protein n=1 Tax=Natrinema sp. HArc-T2 TaxID=3242701 RepID=UPI00359EC0E3